MPGPAVDPATADAVPDAECTRNCHRPSAVSPSSKPVPPGPSSAIAVAGAPVTVALGVSHAPAVKLCRVSTTAASVAAGSRLPDPKVRTPGTPPPEPSQITPGGSSSGRVPFGCRVSTPAVSGAQATRGLPAPQSAAGGTVQNWSVVHWCVTG